MGLTLLECLISNTNEKPYGNWFQAPMKQVNLSDCGIMSEDSTENPLLVNSLFSIPQNWGSWIRSAQILTRWWGGKPDSFPGGSAEPTWPEQGDSRESFWDGQEGVLTYGFMCAESEVQNMKQFHSAFQF